MDQYRFFCNGAEITGRVGSPQLEADIATLSATLTFQTADNPRDPLLMRVAADPGVRIQMFNGSKEVFQGIGIGRGLDGTVKANDYGFFLNKSEIILQCNDVAADTAIRQMGAKAGVQIGHLPAMPTKILDNYIGMTPASILDDILEKVTAERGTKYFYRYESSAGLCIYEYPTARTTVTHQLSPVAKPYNPTWSLGGVSGEVTMEDLRNQVVVIRDENDQATELARAADGASIGQYGLLQHVEQVDEATTAAQANQIAQATVQRLNRLTESYRVTKMLGADEIMPGIMMYFGQKDWGFEGDFIITHVRHTYQPHHLCECEVERA